MVIFMKTSEIIRNMFMQGAGSIVVTTLRGKSHLVKLNKDGKPYRLKQVSEHSN